MKIYYSPENYILVNKQEFNMKDILISEVADKKCLTKLLHNFKNKHDYKSRKNDPISCNSFLYLLSKYTGSRPKLQ